MSRDSANLPAVVLEPPEDAPDMTAAEMLRELQAAHNMQQNLMAMEQRLHREVTIKQGRTLEKIRELHAETRDAMKDLAKPDPVQDEILKTLRTMCEAVKDMGEAIAMLVAMKTNGHGNTH